jgi:hypothetical protein
MKIEFGDLKRAIQEIEDTGDKPVGATCVVCYSKG